MPYFELSGVAKSEKVIERLWLDPVWQVEGDLFEWLAKLLHVDGLVFTNGLLQVLADLRNDELVAFKFLSPQHQKQIKLLRSTVLLVQFDKALVLWKVV